MSTILQQRVQGLFQQERDRHSSPIHEADLANLPAPIQRYLRYAQVVNKIPVQTVRLKQTGQFKMQPEQGWRRMTAEQYYITNPPAFLWCGSIYLLPWVPIRVEDAFVDGHGSLNAKLWSVLTLVNAGGPQFDQGELMRYLAEIAWFPTAWLSEQITWEAMDEYSARATIKVGEIAASAVLHINDRNQLTCVTAERDRLDHGTTVSTPWTGIFTQYQELNGVMVPTEAEVMWHLNSGNFTYFQGSITDIEYDAIAPYSS
ncbi:DUF6920 family protein [Leptolyngbya sp. AN02str]|uniref:DUF6920 family protein n=1 Tax=Leptolyngbya sp. AN02str TaxID=3423363 RepID=UPI003D31E164